MKAQIEGSGLTCDNPSCDWQDPTVTMEDARNWLGKPCPKCGENLLTDEDYLSSIQLQEMMEEVANFDINNPQLSASTIEMVKELYSNCPCPDGKRIRAKVHNGIKFFIEDEENTDASDGQAL